MEAIHLRPWAAVAAAALALGACATPDQGYRPVYLDKEDFPRLPDDTFAAKMRAKAREDMKFKTKMFWGNYGGPGNLGGRPVDAMDWLFYEHDIAYLQGVRLRELRSADRQLVSELRDIEPQSLKLMGRAYRQRAIIYFRLPISRWVGKPKDVLLRTKRGPAVIWVGDDGK